MSIVNQFALYKIKDISTLPFSDKEYSRFKCGSLSIARTFGKQLASKFCNEVLINLDKTDELVVFASAYSYIPNAASLMSRYFIRYMNSWLIENGFTPAMESKIVRKRTYAEEYATLSKEEREERIKDDKYYLDANFTKNKIALFVDDIFITGAHQQMLSQIYEQHDVFQPKQIWFLYFAKLENPAVAATFEGELNYAEIRDIKGIKNLAQTDEFEYIIRTVRYILEASESDFYDYIRTRPFSEKEDIYFSALCEGYGEHPKYQANLTRLKMILHL